MAVHDGFQGTLNPDKTYFRKTGGVIIDLNKENPFSITMRSFFQSGRLPDGQEIDAKYFNLHLKYNFSDKHSIVLGIDYISGNDQKDTANKKSNSFNFLYGSGHSFNGNMEYFKDYLKEKTGQGLINPYLQLSCKPYEKFSFRADFHYFMLQNNLLINNKAINKNLGAEVDLSFIYNINEETTFQLGFSAMRPDKSLETIVGGNSSFYGTWAFAMLTFKPVFFKTGNN